MIYCSRLNEYKTMWLIVFFDLPTETKKQRKDATVFRKRLIADGFTRFQFSIYIRPAPSYESVDVHSKRVKSFLPEEGNVCIMAITDKQFSKIQIFQGVKKSLPPPQAVQLELF